MGALKGFTKNDRDKGAPKILSSLLLFKHLMDISVENCLHFCRQHGPIPHLDHIFTCTEYIYLPQVKKM